MPTSKAWLVVTDPRAAAILLDPDQMTLLKPFMNNPSTVRDAAKQLGVEPAKFYYRLRQLILDVVASRYDGGLRSLVRQPF